MKTIALIAQKGGVGKTTIAVNLAVAAGARTALFDLDQQESAVIWADRRFEYLRVDKFLARILQLQYLACNVWWDVQQLVNTTTEYNMTQPDDPNDEAEEQQGSLTRRPIDTARVGNVEIAIWRNTGTNGFCHTASPPVIRYKDEKSGEWKDSHS